MFRPGQDSANEQVGNPCTFTAPSNAPAGGGTATVTATAGGKSLQLPFTVKEPAAFDHAVVTNLFSYPTNPPSAGAGMHLIVYMKPTDVSFYRVWMEEVGENATNVQGYFTNSYFTTGPNPNSPPVSISHIGQGADVPFRLFEDNSWEHGTMNRDWDQAFTPTLPNLPWSQGRFTWNVPWKWWVEGSSQTNSMTNGWQQVFTIDSSGTVTVSKFGHTVTRTVTQDKGTSN